MPAPSARIVLRAILAPVPVFSILALAAGAVPVLASAPPLATRIAAWVIVTLTALLGALVAHDLAHWLAARLLGFRTVSATIGPFVFVPTRRGMHARTIRSWNELRGELILEPHAEQRANARSAFVAAAGPVASLALGAAALALAPVLAIASLTRFTLSALPFGVRGVPSDGGQLLLLLAGGAPADRLCAMQRIAAAQRAGVRPRSWLERWTLDATALHDGTGAEALACVAAFRRAVDGCAYGRASALLDRALALRAALPRAARCTLLADAAYFEARIHDDATRAQSWLDEAASYRPACPVAERRAAAAVLIANGDFAAGAAAASEALAYVERIEREEWRPLPMEADWLREMIARAECAVVLPAELLALAG
jgi:hypothetical protein